jgi:hypothetical protein
MKTIMHLLLSLLAASAVMAQAQQMEFVPEGPSTSPVHQPEQVKYTLLKPADKSSETVKTGERNPFGKSEAEAKVADQKGTNEENQIRDRLAQLQVVGASPGANGLRVMLGDMVLEPGQPVPKVLSDQTVMSRVGTITQSAIELIWVEKKPSGLPARTMVIPIDLRPYVRYKLQGQPQDKKDGDAADDAPVSRIFPEVAQSAGVSPSHMAQNTAAPRAVPVNDAAEPGAPTTPSELPVPPPPDAKVDPQWEKAMGLLNKILPNGKTHP